MAADDSRITRVSRLYHPAHTRRPDQSHRHIGNVRNQTESDDGNPQAQNTLAEAYYHHFQYTTAAKWFRKAADAGIANAQWRLGTMLMGGMTSIKPDMAVEKNPPQSIRWLFKAASQDHGLSQVALGDCYARGRLIATNRDEAYKWYARSADQGSIIGHTNRLSLLILWTLVNLQGEIEIQPICRLH